ncbi:hypothetical protein PIROE2DRAFT_3303 [Piromyces sp. E2]|nr:hypothetical protein PIROE2DRAFT_3303 [Piromyces sp. E2]|eukprot:OUM68912.1 hypothetical protein PIROE2DRAFT_3303 [Piromyces sp. E2]
MKWEKKKLNLRNQLNSARFDKNGDIDLFLSNMENKFNKLKELNDEVSEEVKTGITVHQDKWNEYKELFKRIVPRLKYLKTIRKNQNRINAYNNETKINKSRNFRNNQNIKCYNCSK